MAKESLKYQAVHKVIWVHNSIKDLGNRIKWVAMGYINMQMELYTKANGKIINSTVEDSMNFLMGLVTKVIGRII